MQTLTTSDLREDHAAVNGILLDLDGVVTNFVRAAARLHNREEGPLLAAWPKGVWDMEVVLGITVKQFLDPLKAQGESFWADMDVYDYADSLFNLCQYYAPTFICTAPINTPCSVAGKLRFIQKWRGPRFRDYVLTPHKELLARPDQLLIDDADKNVTAFRARKGKAILFPQVFNSNHELADTQLEYVESELKKLCGD